VGVIRSSTPNATTLAAANPRSSSSAHSTSLASLPAVWSDAVGVTSPYREFGRYIALLLDERAGAAHLLGHVPELRQAIAQTHCRFAVVHVQLRRMRK